MSYTGTRRATTLVMALGMLLVSTPAGAAGPQAAHIGLPAAADEPVGDGWCEAPPLTLRQVDQLQRTTRRSLATFINLTFGTLSEPKALTRAYIDGDFRPRWKYGVSSKTSLAFAAHPDVEPSAQMAVDRVVAAILAKPPRLTQAAPMRQYQFSTLVPDMGRDGPGVDIDFSGFTTIPGVIAGGNDSGSDIFGDDKRWFEGRVAVVSEWIDGAPSPSSVTIGVGLILRVDDTFDLCPGAQGGALASLLTYPMAQLEALGRARDQGFSVTARLADRFVELPQV